MKIPYKRSKRGIIIEVKVEPRSSRAQVAGLLGEKLKVKLTSPPVEGAANKQLIEVLSKFFGVKKSSISIIRGQSSKNKTIEIEGLSEPPQL
ncbi:MAG: YggU family protein [Nitrospirae bacterium]|nr:MAG: YggU family protein [Nitrospirota bacterium]